MLPYKPGCKQIWTSLGLLCTERYTPIASSERPFSCGGLPHWPPTYSMVLAKTSSCLVSLCLESHASEPLQCSGLSLTSIVALTLRVTSWYRANDVRLLPARLMDLRLGWWHNIIGGNTSIWLWNNSRNSNCAIDTCSIQFGKFTMALLGKSRSNNVLAKSVTSGNSVNKLSSSDNMRNFLHPLK